MGNGIWNMADGIWHAYVEKLGHLWAMGGIG